MRHLINCIGLGVGIIICVLFFYMDPKTGINIFGGELIGYLYCLYGNRKKDE